jgi:predicted PurR-regulated permease PerM
LKDGPKIKPWLIRLLPEKYQVEGQELLDEIDVTWAVFIRVQFIIFLVLGVLILLGTGGVVLLFRAGLLPFSWIGLLALLAIVYTLIQQVDNLWLRPRLLGDRLALHPGLIIVALLGALGVSGVLGALLVVPLLATLKIIVRFFYRRIYGSSPWDDPESPGQLSDEGVLASTAQDEFGV